MKKYGGQCVLCCFPCIFTRVHVHLRQSVCQDFKVTSWRRCGVDVMCLRRLCLSAYLCVRTYGQGRGCLWICACVCLCVFALVFMPVCTYEQSRCSCVYRLHACMYVFVCSCVFACTRTRGNVCLYVLVCMRIYVHMFCVHVCVGVPCVVSSCDGGGSLQFLSPPRKPRDVNAGWNTHTDGL